MCGIFILNIEYNIPSPPAVISFLKTVAGRTETGKSKDKNRVQGTAEAVNSLMYGGNYMYHLL